MSGEYDRSELNGSAPGSPIPSSTTAAPNSTALNGIPKASEDVMYSDIGVMTLLNRLKQSIASARDFAAFLKKRSTLEEEQATGLKRLAKGQLETLRRAEVKTGSYAAQLAEVMRVHERMADNGMQFALSLHQMHEDLNELSANMERGRKQWKHEGLDAEKRASDAEAAMHKAKTKYDSLAEDYDRARTGDTKGSKRIGIKGPKSSEQYESDLLRKTQAADSEYADRVKQAKTQRESLLSRDRPKAVKALQELIRESDSALTLQLQKFATFNEKLLLGNGLAVTPLTDKESAGSQRSMRDIIYEIDNDTDFHSYMRGHASKIPARPSEIKYEQHSTLMPKTQKPSDRQASGTFSQQPPLSVNTAGATTAASLAGSANSRYANNQSAPSYNAPPSSAGGYQQGRPSMDKLNSMQTPSPVSYGQQPPPQLPQLPQQSSYNPSGPTSDSFSSTYGSYNNTGGAAPPYPTYQTDRSFTGGAAPQQTTGSIPPMASGGAAPGPLAGPTGKYNTQTPPPQNQNYNLPPLRPVFGVSLQELFERDQSAVPQVVIQCILAVDTFGLDVEGIYRQSGTASHINTLKQQFDHDASRIDFRNPASFMHDVNSVATLLKQFFRDLPDPLFTHIGYDNFIEAAKIEDENQRRDALHQNINDLPDPNYATMRALVLHLNRVMVNEGRNRMGSSNIAVCFAPSLMGTQTGQQIADASLQARVLDTILLNATAIFDED